MAQASEQKLCPSRTTAWDACTSQVQRGQAQGVAGAITTNQLTVVQAEKDDPRTNTPFPHTIHAKILITILIPDKTPDQERRRLNQSKAWSIKTRKPQKNTDLSKLINAARFINKINSSPSRQNIKTQREQTHSCERVSKDTRHQLK